ncbi:TetR/AcrR family transcriptional regulator [Asticcacaulis sp. W401b]|uniref:TetR/AcrR family transcriptional regulator n=1 Tax=Asticcacaulis sp. W401b TaxID=3388666 RepID=UPI0039709B33
MARPQEFNREDVLEKAMSLFWNKGYEATSLTDLIETTGLSKSSLYSSFGDKHAVFLAAYDRYRAARASEMNAILERGSAREAIETFFRKIVSDAKATEFSDGCMSTNQAVEMAPHDPLVRHRVDQDFKLIEAALARAIERGRTDGSVGDAVNPVRLARLFVVAFPGLQVMVRAGSDIDRLDDALTLLFSHLN